MNNSSSFLASVPMHCSLVLEVVHEEIDAGGPRAFEGLLEFISEVLQGFLFRLLWLQRLVQVVDIVATRQLHKRGQTFLIKGWDG
jgi:hypothetical protein